MTQWISHRGESYDAPENTLAAFELAWQRGTDGVECDVHLTRDRQVVIMHDANTQRTAGRDRLISEQTLVELRTLDAGRWKSPEFAGQRIPTLAELLATIPPGKRTLVEIKADTAIVPFLPEVVNRSCRTPDQIAFMCFNLEVCRAVKSRLPGHHVYLLGVIRQDSQADPPSDHKTVEEFIALAGQTHLDGLALAYQTPGAIAAIQAAGLHCAAWTIDEPDLAKPLLACGIDTIISNRAAFLRDSFTP